MNYNKKGTIIFVPFIVIMSFVLLAYAAVLFQMAEPITKQSVGELAGSLMQRYGDGEKFLFYVDKSAGYAASDAVYDLGLNGGTKENEKCRKVKYLENEYLIWDKDCKPNKQNFIGYFESRFKDYMEFGYPGTSSGYTYSLESDGLKNVLKGIAEGTIDIDVPMKISEEKEVGLSKKPSECDLSNAREYGELIDKYAKENNLDVVVLKAIMWQESKFDKLAVSTAGAAGLMQLMPATAKGLGLKVTSVTPCKYGDKSGCDFGNDERFDPEKNIRAGSKYFADQLRTFGTIRAALAAYNAGPGNYKQYKEQIFVDSRFKETQDYVDRITSCIEKNKASGITGRAVQETVQEEQEMVGIYEVKKSFLINFDYDFSDYDKIYGIVGQKVNSECFKDDNCLKDELGMSMKGKANNVVFIEVETKQRIERFNIKNDGVVIRFGVDLKDWETPSVVIIK